MRPVRQPGDGMTKIRIHFTYRHVEKPWGGANNFIRALHEDLQGSGKFEIVSSIEEPCDILFMNQLGTGPGGNGAMISLSKVKKLLGRKGKRGEMRVRKLVVRAVNLNLHAHPRSPRNITIGYWKDRQNIALLNLADAVIFQSEYQRKVYELSGYTGKRFTVIHNGASRVFYDKAKFMPNCDVLRLVSTGSDRYSKNHNLIAQLSLVDNVEIKYFGSWPQNIPLANVNFLGKVPHDEIVRSMEEAHYFLFPAIKEMCPNSVVEALCAGLPVIYVDGSGSSKEIIGRFGVHLCETDMIGTIKCARDLYTNLYHDLLPSRGEHHISRASKEYMRVFLTLLGADY